MIDTQHNEIAVVNEAPAVGIPQYAVVIPTYNRRAQVWQALQSVLQQTCKASHIIVVDDASTDDTIAFLLEQSLPPEVTLLGLQQNQGVSAARNTALRWLLGHTDIPWIALLDSDDQWLPEKMQRQLETITKNPIGSDGESVRVCHTDELWIRNGTRVNPKKKHAKPSGDVFADCLKLCCMSPSAIVIHRDVFFRVGLFDESLPACEDYDLWLRLAVHYRAHLVPEPLVIKHGGHADQLSRAHPAMDRFRVQAIDKLLSHTTLTHGQRRLALAARQEKQTILDLGAHKRALRANAPATTELQPAG